ncbi:MAG: hypothetical protein HYZ29_10550 [Myxococcales bacterium]|nr:hypothetical protein [Myxococcales bacterium]
MRLELVIVVAALGLGVTQPAAAERRGSAARSASALEVTLLEGWRATGPHVDLGRQAAAQKEAAEPGQELSLAVERMWSQARVHRRPGGAELIVRGRF